MYSYLFGRWAVSNGFSTNDIFLKFQSELQRRFSKMLSLASNRQHRLQESNRFFHFLREADEIEDWIKEKGTIATSEDYGRDLEHVEMLMKKFEDFTRDLMSSGERVASLTAEAQGMLNENHSDSEVKKQTEPRILAQKYLYLGLIQKK